jgi:hypothetical protein
MAGKAGTRTEANNHPSVVLALRDSLNILLKWVHV